MGVFVRIARRCCVFAFRHLSLARVLFHRHVHAVCTRRNSGIYFELGGVGATSSGRRSDLIQPCFEFGWWDHRRILFMPLEKVSVTADNEVGVVSACEVDHLIIVLVTG
jgi:hypothetical protein